MAADLGSAIEWFVDTMAGLDGNMALAAILGVLALCGLGLPLPEDIILITAGFLAALGKFSLVTALVAGMIGVLSGDTALFFLGRRYGTAVWQRPLVHRFISPERIELAHEKVRDNARFICFIARFLPGLRSPIYLAAGSMGVSPRTFWMQDGIAALISVPLWVVGGWYFGEHIDKAIELAHALQGVILGAVLATVVGYVGWLVLRNRQTNT